MQKPEIPKNEYERLEAVKKYNILDTIPETDFDNITSLIANICDTPISLVALLDKNRNFLKSHHGIPFNESPRDISFCGHAILSENPIFIIENTKEDERFFDNPIVLEHNIAFYAGVPLINPDGFALGTLCIYDYNPKKLSEQQKNALKILAKQVVNVLELRHKNIKLKDTLSTLKERHKSLKTFANKVSHDLKSPLANITSLSQLFKDELKNTHSNIDLEYLNFIEESADSLRGYIDGMLRHYKTEELLKKNKKEIYLKEIFNNIKQILILNDENFKLQKNIKLKKINASAITQILLNLVDNAFKYNSKKTLLVTIDYSENETHSMFLVKDNGVGIEKNKLDSLFKLFNTAHETDKNGNKGTGIGLYTVKTLVSKLGGTIEINSDLNHETVFIFTVKK